MSGLRRLRLLSRVEGCSLLALLLIAMPLKYAFGLPIAVRIAGSVHGVFFLALLFHVLQALLDKAQPKGLLLRVLGWSVVPFGFLVVDRDLRGEAGREGAPGEAR